MFYAPSVVWHAFNSRGGVDADSILETSLTLAHTKNAEKREKTVETICKSMDSFLKPKQEMGSFSCDLKSIWSATLCRPCGKRFQKMIISNKNLSEGCCLFPAF